MSIKIPQQSETRLAAGRISEGRPSGQKSSLFQKLAFGAGLATTLGFGAAACVSNSSEIETGSEPDAAGEMRGVADDAGTETREDGGREDGGDESRDDAGAPVPPEGPDFDRDGVPDDEDRCLAGDDNDDIDNDGLARACDPCPNTPPEAGRSAGEDNDFDGVGTRCDLDDTPVTGFDPNNRDTDLDRVLDRNDNCDEPNGIVATADCNGDGESDPPGQVDCDRDGVGTPCDCDDNNPAVHPSVTRRIPPVPEVTDIPGDGVDSDCDGIGQQVGLPNADGTVVIEGEPDYTCIPGNTRNDPDGVATGECEVGTQTCTRFPGGSAFGAVSGNVDAVPEVCNGLDDDCDGSNDEDITCDCVPGATQACGEDEGECEPGEQTCGADRTWGECVGGTGPAEEETCDGDDEDCDGDTDEDFRVGEACTGVGACGVGGSGVKECASSSTVRCSTNPGGSADRSTAEVCDGADNDCDGSIDEGSFSVVGGAGTSASVGTACSLPGLCGPGTHVCAGTGAVECGSAADRVQSPGLLESPGYCNGLDDDCDGQADEGCDCVDGEEALICGTSTGACNQGLQLCENGAFSPDCTGTFVGPEAETCDGVDDDCDGIIDNINGRVAGAACTGVGRCGEIAGVLECVSPDALGCSTMPGGTANRSTAEVCDGVDNDCDGLVDEGDWPDAGAVGLSCSLPGECGSGATRCATTAATECSSIDRASPDGPPGACDERDNDCDGATDEGCSCLSGDTRDCGESTGACSEGTQSCSGGVWGDCVGDVVPATELCDGVDNDCDGSRDNGFGVGDACRGRGECGTDTPGTPADEGLGALECATPTTTRCSVNPDGTSDQSTDERCNGLDDDCDGRVDEDFNIGEGCRLPGVCGAGVNRCRDEFNEECSSEDRRGTEIPANGLDDDCDGDVDE